MSVTKEVHLFDFVAESSKKYFKPKLCKACIEYKARPILPRAALWGTYLKQISIC